MAKFVSTVELLRRGRAVKELDDQMLDLTRMCMRTGRKGTITLTLTLKPGKSGQIEIADKIVTKAPTIEAGTTLLFPDEQGELHQSHPAQLSIEGVREVNVDSPIRSVN